MNKKKILIPAVIAACGLCAAGGWRIYRYTHVKVAVMPVSSLDQGYMGNDQSLYGMVYEAGNQSVTLDGTASVAEVYVSEGQEVHVGDKLFAYDVSDLQLSVEKKRLELEQAQNSLQSAVNRQQILKNTKPKEENHSESEPTMFPEPEKKDDNGNGLHTVISSLNDAYEIPEENDVHNPVRFACTPSAVISMKVIAQAKSGLSDGASVYLSFEGYSLNEGEQFDLNKDQDRLESQWLLKIDQNSFSDMHEDQYLNLKDHEEDVSETSAESTPDIVGEEPGYTAEELVKAVRDTEADIRSLDLDVRKKQLELSTSEESLSDGIVYAQKDGIVTKVSDPSNPPQDGSPFLMVSSSTGTVLQGQISEMILDQLHAGDSLTVMDWNSGNTYEASVESIDTIPSSSGSYYGGNPNASWYNFYAVTSGPTDLSAADGVEMSLPASDNDQSLWIEMAYVRKDSNGQYYVMKDENGKLVRQNVSTGAVMYGYAINIKEGLSRDDLIAFPYGRNVREGVHTEESDGAVVG